MRRLVLVLLTLVAAAAVPAVAQAAPITEFSGGLTFATAITNGPDGNMWFTDTHAIGRITTSGAITEFSSDLNPGAEPFGDILVGSDRNIWFADIGTTKAIGRITTSGTITEFDLPAGQAASNLVLGPDGNIWFLAIGTPKGIGRIKPDGTIDVFTAGLNPNTQPNDLAVGPDENLWFTDQGDTKAIGRVKTDGTIDEFTGPLTMTSFPNEITDGPDGNVWFTDDGSPAAIGRVKPDGTIDEFSADLQTGAEPDSITAGSDGNIWFADQESSQRAIGRVTPAGAITEFHNGLATGLPDDITVGPDGNLWVEQSNPGGVARVAPSGVITEFTDGLNTGAGADGDQIIGGPDGNLWFNDGGMTKAIARVLLQSAPLVATGVASHLGTSGASVAGSVTPLGATATVAFEYGTSPSLGKTVAAGSLPASTSPSTVTATLSGLPAATVIYYRVKATDASGTASGAIKSFKTSKPPGSTATVGNQQLQVTLTFAGACVAKGKTVTVAFRSTVRRHGTKLKFLSASLFLDKGVKRGRHFKANKVWRRVPASVKLGISGLRSGTHTVKVTAVYKSVVRHGHAKTVSKTLSVKFRVC